MGITSDLLIALRQRYSGVYPLIFLRSVERASTPGEAFDILESIPQEYPIVWDDNIRRWVTTKDMLQSRKENHDA